MVTKIERNWSIPTDLIKAVQGKGITFLVGAGASQDSPARVPAWAQLAVLLDKEIGENQSYRFDKNNPFPAKYIWDRIKEDQARWDWIIDRIEEAAERMDNKRKVPSLLHEKLMHMAYLWGGENVLVLTTNYDLLLEAAAEQGSDWLVSPTRWTGPANGKAAAARGIYHLHGTLENRESILLTDAEMQCHYKTEENVHSRYLQEIFRDRVVLVIGYRFGDPEIKQILNNIDPYSSGQTYAIIEQTRNGKIPAVLPERVKAVSYANGQHHEVKEILDRINKMARTTSATAQAKAWQEIGRKGPGSATPKIWEQIGELIETGDEQLDHFLNGTTEAKNPDEWIGVDMLDAGLSGVFRIKELTEGERKLCRWLALNLTGVRLKKIIWAKAVAGGLMHPELQYSLGRELQDKERYFSIEDLRIGIEILCSQGIIGGLHDPVSSKLGLIAERIQKMDPFETDTGLEVIRVLTEVVAQPDGRWQYEEHLQPTKIGIPLGARTRSNGHRIERTWKKIGTRLVENVPEELWEIASTALRRQQRITDICGGKKNSFNSWNYFLPSIEERDQLPDWDKGGRYVLLDAASRGISKMGCVPDSKERWAACVERAIKEDSPLLRRIAVDSVRKATHWNAARKLEWVSSQDRMNDWHTWRERYLLIKQTWHDTKEETKEVAAMAIAKMVPKIGGERQNGEEADFRRASMISWLEKQGIEHHTMEIELKRLLKKYPHMENNIGKEDRSEGEITVRRFKPISPNSPDDLINDWREKGDEALDKLIEEWFTSIDDADWSKGPNLEGATKALEEAVAKCVTYGLELSQKLSERQLWNHRAWKSLTKAMPMHFDTLAGRKWLEETNWAAVNDGNTEVDLEEMLYFASRRALDEEWNNETMEAIYNALKGRTTTDFKVDKKRKIISDNYNGALEQAIDKPEGKLINAIMNLWKLQIKKEKAGSASEQLNSREMMTVVENLAVQEDTYTQIYATVLLARDYELVRQEVPGVVERVLHRKLESKDALWRNVVWDGLWYCKYWTYGQMGESLKAVMQKDLLEHDEPPSTSSLRSEYDQVADRYGLTMALRVWQENDNYKNEWQIDKISKKRRQAVVASICHIFDRTDAMHEDGWEKLIAPLWEDIAGESGTETTEEEQRALTACFRHLNERDQDEFANRFVTGPTVVPDRLIGHLDKNPNIANREAALKILIHCSKDRTSRNPNATEIGDWYHILNVVQKHWSGTTIKTEEYLVNDLLSLHGIKV